MKLRVINEYGLLIVREDPVKAIEVVSSRLRDLILGGALIRQTPVRNMRKSFERILRYLKEELKAHTLKAQVKPSFKKSIKL